MEPVDPRLRGYVLLLDLTKATDMELTYRGLCQATWLRTERARLEKAKAEIETRETLVRELEWDLERTNVELQSRTAPDGQKYHDIGHARSQFEEKTVDGKRVPLTPEELDPTVAAYLERRKLFEE